MKIPRRVFLSSTLAATVAGAFAPTVRAQPRHLMAYDSEAQMREALERWQQRSQQAAPRRRSEAAGAASQDSAIALNMAPAAPAALAKSEAQPAASERDSITNVQTAGVDEGG